MGNFRSDSRSGGFRDRDSRGFGGDRSGGRSFRGDRGGRSSGFGRDRPRPEMHDAVCSDCGKECQVPFRPTGSKPVRCSDCHRAAGGGSSSSRPRSFSAPSSGASGISQEQFKQINTKLDKIISILDQIEFENIEEGEEEEEESVA
jgi:CxxC-x17-CxxC domain-containing protein